MNLLVYTGLSKHEVKSAFKWVSRQNEELVIEIFKSTKSYFYKQKNLHPNTDVSILSAAAFLQAVTETKKICSIKRKKEKDLKLHSIKSPIPIRVKHLKRRERSVKYERLLNLKSVILKLIETEGSSYRQVSAYLKRYHHFDVSHTMIGQVYKKLKGIDNV